MRSERLRTALIIAAAVILAGLFAWSFVRDVGAQGVCAWLCGEFCESLDDTYPDDAPWHLERSRDEGEQCWCECCDALRRISYQARFPNATAIPATATLEPTSTATDTPTSTATRRPPTAVPTAIPATATPEPTFTRVNTPTPTLEPKWTITPHIPVPPASPTMTPAASPTSSQTSTASPTVGETPTPEIVAQPETILPAAPMRRPVMLPCLPKHAARPVALCETRSGSGWWLYFIGPGGRVVSGPHVPYPSAALAGRTGFVRHWITGQRVALNWQEGYLLVRTAYADGKPYVFRITREGRVEHAAW